jgi:hypothetical protein
MAVAHSNILSSDFGLGLALRQSGCQNIQTAKWLITKDLHDWITVTDGSRTIKRPNNDPALEQVRVKNCRTENLERRITAARTHGRIA